MTERLTPCPACARHVKAGDCTCPFCGAKAACAGPPARVTSERLSRAALFAASALGTVLGATDCSSSSQPAYGAPPVEAGPAPSDASAPGDAADAADESPGVVALYGGFAPVDASTDRNDAG